jgi:acetylglutamate/LysW-gamma-L-alpha-aminoadipate kinase
MIVVKIGGELLDNLSNIAEDLKNIGEDVVVVHGGGDEVSKIAEKMGKKQVFVVSPEGIRSRYTDEEDIKIYLMVMAGLINKKVVLLLAKHGLKAIGLCGVDLNLIVAKRKRKLIVVDERGRMVAISGDYSGKVESVNVDVLNMLTSNGYIPVIAPVAVSLDYEFLNIDADSAASSIASSIKASSIVFLTDVDGVMINGKKADVIRIQDVDSILKSIGFGMNRKIMAAANAVKMGVGRAVIAPGYVSNPVFKAINGVSGTVIM